MARHQIELRQLRSFVALGRALHFGRAATLLGIAQPALSQHIKALEKRMGVQLLERSTRRVMLTQSGQDLLSRAEAILAQLDEAVVSAQVIAGHKAGLLRVGVIHSAVFNFNFLPTLLPWFRRRYPEVRLEVSLMGSQEVVTALEKGELQVGLLRPPQEPGKLRTVSLFKENLVAAMRDSHRLAARTILRLDDLVGERLLQLSRPDLAGAFQDLEAVFAKRGLAFATDEVAANTLSAMSIVASGGCIAFVPDWVRRMEWHGIAIRSIADLPTGIDLAIAWRGDDPRPAIVSFVEMAQRVAAEQVGAATDASAARPVRPRRGRTKPIDD
jgi:DNA-binding transcriptional LysR family regulator